MDNRIMHIGLCGANGSGKTTFANLLRTERGFVEVNFAEPIERAFDALVGDCMYRIRRDLKDQKVPGWNFSYREFAENYGSFGFLGDVDDHWFIKPWLKLIEKAENQGRNIVFSNVRSVIQIDYLREHYNTKIVNVVKDIRHAWSKDRIDAIHHNEGDLDISKRKFLMLIDSLITEGE